MPTSACASCKPLGFGRADVVVAVPACWLDVRRMADLEEMSLAFRRLHGRRVRVATKYMNLARRFFAQKGVTGYRIVESLGATEGTPAAGLAELIVDITTTGATLKANGLKVLDDGVILTLTGQPDRLQRRALDGGAARAGSPDRRSLPRVAVIPGFMPGIHRATSGPRFRCMQRRTRGDHWTLDRGDKPRDDITPPAPRPAAAPRTAPAPRRAASAPQPGRWPAARRASLVR